MNHVEKGGVFLGEGVVRETIDEGVNGCGFSKYLKVVTIIVKCDGQDSHKIIRKKLTSRILD